MCSGCLWGSEGGIDDSDVDSGIRVGASSSMYSTWTDKFSYSALQKSSQR